MNLLQVSLSSVWSSLIVRLSLKEYRLDRCGMCFVQLGFPVLLDWYHCFNCFLVQQNWGTLCKGAPVGSVLRMKVYQ